jgi:transcriptional regulator with XRE-family HTH domain
MSLCPRCPAGENDIDASMAGSSKIAMRVGQRVRQLRTASGFTQAQLAERAGMATQAVSRIERGERSPTLETVDRLAAALGVRLGVLADAAQTVPRPQVLAPGLAAIIEPLVGQPDVMRDRAARLIRALVDE